MEIFNRVRKTIQTHGLLHGDETVVVGVSGGADSVACLLILKELGGLGLVVAHFDHGLRGEESRRDAEFVERLAGELGLAFELGSGDTRKHARESRRSIEEAARELRYDFLFSIKEKHSAARVATAHTLDDQAETVLMRLLRGSGPRGLGGIPPLGRRGVIRPLIDVSKDELISFLASRGVSHVTDTSNLQTDVLRNELRLNLMPVLERYNPSLKAALARTAGLERMCWDFIAQEAARRRPEVFGPAVGGELVGDIDALRALHPALRYELLRDGVEEVKGDLRRVSLGHIAALDALVLGPRASGTVVLPRGVVAEKGYGKLLICRGGVLGAGFAHTIDSPGVWSYPELECEVGECEDCALDEGSGVGVFDIGSVGFPIEVRSFEAGMRFQPLGMDGVKKIKRFFIDEKLPRFLRSRVPIFLSGGEVFWVGGMRVDERFKYRGGRGLRIRLTRPGPFLPQ